MSFGGGDVAICQQAECPVRMTCARFGVRSDSEWQVYVAPEFGADGCELYIPRIEESEERAA